MKERPALGSGTEGDEACAGACLVAQDGPKDKNPPFPAGSQERTTGFEPATLSLGS